MGLLHVNQCLKTRVTTNILFAVQSIYNVSFTVSPSWKLLMINSLVYLKKKVFKNEDLSRIFELNIYEACISFLTSCCCCF